jgi:hypothetical protein
MVLAPSSVTSSAKVHLLQRRAIRLCKKDYLCRKSIIALRNSLIGTLDVTTPPASSKITLDLHDGTQVEIEGRDIAESWVDQYENPPPADGVGSRYVRMNDGTVHRLRKRPAAGTN